MFWTDTWTWITLVLRPKAQLPVAAGHEHLAGGSRAPLWPGEGEGDGGFRRPEASHQFRVQLHCVPV